MPCFHPLKGYKARNGGLTFRKSETSGIALTVPCGQCIGCRIDYSKQWAVRMIHESRRHSDSCFLTLTYDDDHLPANQSLVPSDLQKFWKRYRKAVAPRKIRYYACGEYGDENLRPHYHAALFGHLPDDLELFSGSRGYSLYTSEMLAGIWGKGHCTVGHLTPETCAYTARYITKKITGPPAEQAYERVLEGGELVSVLPEFSRSSRRPGIGFEHFQEFCSDIYPDDFVVHNGRKSKTPRFYDKLLDRANPELLEQIRQRRRERARSAKAETTPERLGAREEYFRSSISRKKRDL